jgi:hypothetical protein
MTKEKNLFDFLNAIFYKKDIQYDKKIANSYLISLWLSHDRNLINVVNNINKYIFRIPDEATFLYYKYKVPRGKRFIKWIKKEKIDDKTKEKIEKLMKEYNISEREARESIITKEDI